MPHPKKATSPIAKPVSFRVPLDEIEVFKETQQAAAEFLGVSDQPYADFKTASLAYGRLMMDESLRGFGKRDAAA